MKPRLRRSVVILLALTAVGVLSGVGAAAAPIASGLMGQASGSGAASPSPSAEPTSATHIVIIGDSLSTGHGTSPEMAWPNLLQNDTRGGDHPFSIVNAAVDGSGYISTGDGGATFLSEADRSVQRTTQLVLIFGSENDMGADSNQLKQAAASTLAEIAAKAPDATIVVVGPPSYTDSPEPGRLQVRDEDRAAASEAGAVFVDPIKEHWIMGDAEDLIGPDGDHPSVDGQHYLQKNMEKIIQANLP